MNTYEFAFVVEGVSVDDPTHDDRLTANGAPDAMLFEVDGVTQVAFYRAASTAIRAATGAMDAIRAAFPLARIIDLDPDLVSVSDIADRTGLTRQAIRMYATGERGRGNFPRALGTVGAGHRVWTWAAVYEWMLDTPGINFDADARPVPEDVAIQLRAMILDTLETPRAEPLRLSSRVRSRAGSTADFSIHVQIAAETRGLYGDVGGRIAYRHQQLTA